jgi:HTH-type transcriptional regulator / antitoxin HigA
MSSSTRARGAAPTYLKLVRAHPLRSLRSDAELEAAQAVLDRLLRADLDSGEQEYLDALTDLIETYEASAHPIPDAAEADVLRLLMEGRGLTQQGLAREVGIAQSTLSAVVSGERQLTKGHITKLSTFFDVSPAVFFPRRYERFSATR